VVNARVYGRMGTTGIPAGFSAAAAAPTHQRSLLGVKLFVLILLLYTYMYYDLDDDDDWNVPH